MKKISQTTIEQLKATTPDELVAHGIIREAPNHKGKNGYVCPLCGSGTGENKTGAGAFNDNNQFYCHSCGNESKGRHAISTIDLFAISRKLEHENFGEQCCQMANEFHVPIDYEGKEATGKRHSKPTKKIKAEIKPPQVDEKELTIIRADLAAADENLADFVNFGCENKKWRGLPLELLLKFGCRYVPEWTPPKSRVAEKYSTKTPRVLIPCSNESYLARLTVPIEDFDEQTRQYVYAKEHAGTKALFNAAALNSGEMLFAVEGYVDAMSIELAGFKAVALGGRNQGNLLVDAIKPMALEDKPRVIILLDSDKQGRESAPKLKADLLNVGCLSVVEFLSDTESKIDCNEILTTQGLDNLREQLQKIYNDAQDKFDALEKEIAENWIKSFTPEERDFYFALDRSDLANARRLEKFCGDRVRWLTDAKDEHWLLYGNGVWQHSSDKNSAILPLATKLHDALQFHIDGAEDLKAAKCFRSSSRVNGAISLLKGCKSILITGEDLDKHSNLLCCLNGVVDLQDGKLYPHEPKYLITQQCRAAYFPNANSEIVNNFFRDIQPDEMTRAGLLRWLGYCLCAEVNEEKFMVWHGGGANGKGVLSATILELLGSYGVGLAPTALLKSNRPFDADKSTTALNGLELARFAISEEMPADGEFDVSLVKNLSGGDRINLRRLHAEYHSVKPTAKLNLSGNYLPKIENIHDDGLLRRMVNMPFTVKFGTPENPADHNLKKKMLAQDSLNALLSLLVSESIKRYRDGLIISPLMTKETKRHLEQNDFIADFIGDNYEYGTNLAVKAKDFIDELKREFPRETNRFKRADLINLVSNIDGVTYGVGRGHMRIFKGIGKAGAPRQQDMDFGGAPVAPDEAIPFDA